MYGDLYNRYRKARPHQGYAKLKEIIEMAQKQQKHFIYHAGIDKLYLQSGFDRD